MGLKRSFENEEFQELPFKNMKCVESIDKLASFGEIVPFKDASQNPNISGRMLFVLSSLMLMPYFLGFLESFY